MSARRMNMIGALGNGVLAAASLLEAGEIDSARAILSTLHTAYVSHLRSVVAEEPGGVLHKGAPRAEGKRRGRPKKQAELPLPSNAVAAE